MPPETSLKEIKTAEEIPDRFKNYFPDSLPSDLFLQEGSVLTVRNPTLVATDIPRYTALCKDPARSVEGITFLNQFKTTLSKLVDLNRGLQIIPDLHLLIGAGDEIIFMFMDNLDPLQSIVFAFVIQATFTSCLEEFPNIKRFLQNPDGRGSYVHVGIQQLGPDEFMGITVADLVNRKGLLTFGKNTVKDLAKGFITSQSYPTEVVTFTKIEQHTLELLQDKFQLEIHIESVHLPTGQTATRYSISNPPNTDPRVFLDQLRSTSAGLTSTPESPPHHRSSPHPPDDHLLGIARLFAPPYKRDSDHKFPPDAHPELNTERGEFAFFFVKGFGELQDVLTRQSAEFNASSELIIFLATQAAAYTANRLSQVLDQRGWMQKEVEIGPHRELRLITTHNIYRINPSCPGYINLDVFSALSDCVRLPSSTEFENDLLGYLKDRLKTDSQFSQVKVNTPILEKAIRSIGLTTQVGLTSCLADSFDWHIQEPNAGTYLGCESIGGSGLSGAARLGGIPFNRNYVHMVESLTDLELRAGLSPTEETHFKALKSLMGTVKPNGIVLQEAVARHLGLIDPDNPNVVVLPGIMLKGFSHSLNLCYIGSN